MRLVMLCPLCGDEIGSNHGTVEAVFLFGAKPYTVCPRCFSTGHCPNNPDWCDKWDAERDRWLRDNCAACERLTPYKTRCRKHYRGG